jgi:23S rRNA pseudouridine1911/1915/1917 synthase
MNIIYENKDVLVVNKPAGITVHPDQAHKTGTLIQEISKIHPEIKNVGEDKTRPGIVHRLDKDTSGILIIAKNQPTFEYLKRQFAERKIKKTYIALVIGLLKQKSGIINVPIGRSKSPLRRLASPKARGKLREAVTEYKILENLKGYTLVEAYPLTGRTHQIRVHFKAIGHAVVCDKLYSKKPICPFGLNRQFLHAFSLELVLPDGSRSRFEADLPDDLKKVLAALRKEKKCANN